MTESTFMSTCKLAWSSTLLIVVSAAGCSSSRPSLLPARQNFVPALQGAKSVVPVNHTEAKSKDFNAVVTAEHQSVESRRHQPADLQRTSSALIGYGFPFFRRE